MAKQQTAAQIVIEMMDESYLRDFLKVEQHLKCIGKSLGVGWRGLSLLSQIAKNDRITLDVLAKQNHITKGAISTQIKTLLQFGLIEVEVSPDDRRQHFIHLTLKGKRVIKELDVHEKKTVAAILEKMSLKEITQLSKYFEHFVAVLDQNVEN
ncbi:MarR family winged helix-turn-helix transcriptional regulator [Furfurilactobacillus milii]|uniref:MarR family transcriptional regulator n=1 Tax=Furfurilactobacillus milii TaxID=2888272 RepID=A0A6N9HZG0_9LACO|nr:MarR family transcriptional regulator [Furfurilactobacillus milii]MYV16252.1 MarR family transcriptional regulator [Furfurilactobacillus milii]